VKKFPLLMRHLRTQIEEEREAQRELLALLETQEAAIAAANSKQIVEAGLAVEQATASASVRSRRRDVLLKGFANLWELEPGTLTFSSVIERAGETAGDLQAMRDDLRDTASKVTRKARNIRTLALAHQRLTMEILEALFASDSEGSVAAGGVLVDAEA